MESLFDNWSTYEKVVANDYMHHRNFFAALERELVTRLDEPLSIIDLGCGDCEPVDALLRHADVSHYVGIDNSKSALARAETNLTAAGVRFSLHCGNMLDVLRRLDGEHNVAIASYALHHFEKPEKQDILTECRRVLRDDGLLAVIDVFRNERESRHAYFDRWEANAKLNYTALAADEFVELLTHVRSCDFPETLSVYRRLGAAAGFEQFRDIAEDRDRLNRLVVLFPK